MPDETKLQQATRIRREAKHYRDSLKREIGKHGPTKFLSEELNSAETSIRTSESTRKDIIAEEHRKESMGEDYNVDKVDLDKVLSEGSANIWSNPDKNTKRR